MEGGLHHVVLADAVAVEESAGDPAVEARSARSDPGLESQATGDAAASSPPAPGGEGRENPPRPPLLSPPELARQLVRRFGSRSERRRRA